MPPPPPAMGRGTQILRFSSPRMQICPRSQSVLRVQVFWQTPKSQIDPVRQSVSALQA